MELSAGDAFGPYRLISRAGSGGMAEVWRAYDERLRRYVAIKFLSPRYATDEFYLERFRHEAQAISRLDHPNILTIHDYGEQDGWTYMVSPFVGGGTLALQLRRGPWTVQEAVAVLEPLAAALDCAHAEGIVHRDVKPSNVLLSERGRLVLSDFGVARMIEGSTLLSQAGLVVGTPTYMSPEQADGQRVTGASDLYSLGVIAYEMLTGRPPFMAETPLAQLRAHIDKPLPPPRTLNPALPEPVEATLFTIMAKNPANRFASGQAFVDALRAAATLPAPGPAPAPAPTPPARQTNLPLLVDGTALTLPLDPPVPPSDLEPRLAHSVPIVAPLAIITVAWGCAWVLLMLLRSLDYEPLARLLGMDPGELRLLMGTLRLLIGLRVVGATGVGLIGAGGVVVALLVAGVVRDRRAVLALLGGWTVSYILVHATVYLITSVLGGPSAPSIDELDEALAFFRGGGPSWVHILARSIDILPAALGGLVTAYVLRNAARGMGGRIVLGWTLAASLAVLAAWLVVRADDVIFVGELTDGPRRNGLTLGVVAGIVQGIVGGWLTLSGLRRSS
jgi:serine/threonine protein kinase